MNKRSVSFLLILAMLMSMIFLSFSSSTNGLEPPNLQPPAEPTPSEPSADDIHDPPPLVLPPSGALNLNAAAFPYSDGFESGVLGSEWTEYTTADGREVIKGPKDLNSWQFAIDCNGEQNGEDD